MFYVPNSFEIHFDLILFIIRKINSMKTFDITEKIETRISFFKTMNKDFNLEYLYKKYIQEMFQTYTSKCFDSLRGIENCNSKIKKIGDYIMIETDGNVKKRFLVNTSSKQYYEETDLKVYLEKNNNFIDITQTFETKYPCAFDMEGDFIYVHKDGEVKKFDCFEKPEIDF